MSVTYPRSIAIALLALSPVLAELSALGQTRTEPIELRVDLGDAPQRQLHARMTIPVDPGPLTLLYPQWIPGEHGPTGPIADLAGLKISADGSAIGWRRDPTDMYAFHLEVPEHVTKLDVALDYLAPGGSGQFTSGAATSDRVVVLSWNTVLLYPAGVSIHELMFRPSLSLPPGWELGTALSEERRQGTQVEFAAVSLAELVDSPVAAGRYHRLVDVTGDAEAPHRVHLIADSEAALGISTQTREALRRLVAETLAVFGGAYHYRHYDFLLTLSDHVASFGLEHHESSDNRVAERTLIDPARLRYRGGLLPHEFVHSWNAKYRRPAGLTRDDYRQPFDTDLLWVYEGLTSYLGTVLSARSGLWSPAYTRESLALIAARLETQPGRSWRPLLDTARSAQILYGSRSEGASWRRGVDFYDEGVLIWLEADALIRLRSGGKRSLEDFCRSFYGGPSGQPRVVPYGYDQLVAAMSSVAANDWPGFFDRRVASLRVEAPLAGLENAGWRLIYTAEPNLAQQDFEKIRELTDVRFSLGFSVSSEDGRVLDVLPGSPAGRAGLAPAATLVAVNGRRWSPEILRAAIQAARAAGSRPIRLLVENDEFFEEIAVDYHGGERHPHLQRIPGRDDVLAAILRPATP